MALTIVRNPTAVWALGGWSSTHGIGTEVAVVTDVNDATYMGNPSGAFTDLGYEFEDIDEPAGTLITSCITSHRVLFPPNAGAVMYPRAWLAGTSYVGPPFDTAAPTTVIETRTYDWITQLNTHGGTVGVFNGARFGCHANWVSAPPSLVKLSAAVTYTPAEGGFAFLLASLGPLAAIGLEHMDAMVRHLSRTRQAWFPVADYARALVEYRALTWPAYSA